MRNVTRLLFLLILLSGVAFNENSYAQSVMNPADPVITYNSATPPTQPAWGSIGKWVRTRRVSWNTDDYKCYVYKGVAFRVKFPKTYNETAVDGKRYPMLLFFHGLGETGNIYDNEYSLYHGGELFKNAVNDGSFDGYVLVMQSQGGWGDGHYTYLTEIINYMVANNKLSPFQISDNGLSAGGYGSWDMMIKYPSYIAQALPMSGVGISYRDAVNTYKYTPVWYFQGGLDGAPHPNTAEQVVNAITAAGGNIRYTLYPTLGHGTWYTVWGEPDFFPSLNRVYASNPWPLTGRTEFCAGDPINVTMGVAPGFDQYQWRKDNVDLPNTTNAITVTTVGKYECRVRKGTVWSDWSRTPVNLRIKAPTVTPSITVSGLMSKVIPALDTDSVTLALPTGYTSYVWQKTGNTTTLSTTNTLKVGVAGDYIARVTELYGCSSTFSAPFTVINANGPNAPSPAVNLSVSILSKTSLRLDWNDNPAPAYNETNYEIYQSQTVNSAYKLVAVVPANTVTYTLTNLKANTKYYYKVRAINATAASAGSNEASGTTETDSQPPTAPGNLVVSGTTRTSVGISWSPSTDDIGVVRYDIYINGQRSYSTTTATTFTINGLERGKSYNFAVLAKDASGNLSPFSNQVTGQPLANGLEYKYYTFTGDWNNLPNFNNLTPVARGFMPNVALTPRTQDDNFAFMWEGYITIPTTGTYYFRTNSDDGSMLFLGSQGSTTSPYNYAGGSTLLVNNDGLHGGQDATSNGRVLQAGVYPIVMTFYEQGGGETMTVSWRTPSSGGNYNVIPNSAFQEAAVNNGAAPTVPSALVVTAVSHRKINVSWTDNATTETGFEIWRSTNAASGHVPVGQVGPNVTTFVDSVGLSPSTTYYYKVRAIGQYGESAYIPRNDAQANWKFNNNLTDASGNGKVVTASGSTYSTDRQEGTHSIDLNGSGGSIPMTTTSGDYIRGGYTAKSVTFWMKADVTSSGTNRYGVFDFGGSDDGLGMYISGNTLYAGIASDNTRRSISTAYSSLGWNHIALVYNVNSLILYVNGVQVAQNTNLGFTEVESTSNNSEIGDYSGTTAFNNTYNQSFNGKFDDFAIFGRALSLAEINALRTGQYEIASATTAVLPATPARPTNLLATAVSTTSVDVDWTDAASNETGYELYRATNTPTTYIKIATLAPNTNTYLDTDLFASSVYYYRVRALGEGSNSLYSNEDSAKTLNNNPVIYTITNKSMHRNGTLTVNVQAVDPDGGYVTLNIGNLPPFGVFNQVANGIGAITFNPAGTQGVYNLSVTATDDASGVTVAPFTLTVNDNYNPDLNPITNYTLTEGQTVDIELNAHDQNIDDILTYSVSNLPEGYTLTPGQYNGDAVLTLQPNYAASGRYEVEVKVTDGHGGEGVQVFVLTVNDKDPNTRIYVRSKANNEAGAPWNNFAGITTSNLKDETGATTTVGVTFQENWWWATFTDGPTTGNNSGVYPDAVLRDYYYFGIFGGPEVANVNVTGLNPANKYHLTFFASSIWSGAPDNGTTIYKVGAQQVSLAVQNNRTNTVSLNNLTPAANGTISFSMSKAPGSPAGFLNALVITKVFDDGSAPAAPKSLGLANQVGGVKLSWTDVAYNETSYEVYRSATQNGTYNLVGTAGVDASGFLDNTIAGGSTYFYKVRAVNSYGQSAYTAVVSIATQNIVPMVTVPNSVVVKNNQVINVNVSAMDDPTDNVTLTVTGLPSFATFTDNGNKTGTITISPAAGSVGVYTGITVKATDNAGASSTATMDIFVVESKVSSTFVNFSDGNQLPGKPWNNWFNPPFGGSTISNLLNDENVNTGMSIVLTDAWGWWASTGNRPRNGTEIYPEGVVRKSIFFTDNNNHRMTLSGLNPAKKYNFVFFNSHDVGENATTNFTINGTTVSLNGSYNSNKTVQINGIVPAANGQLVITVSKNAAANFGMLSSLIIQSYTPAEVPVLSPADLRVVDNKKTSVTLQWQDRADNETGYEIWKAANGGSNYVLLTTVAANVTTYTDATLAANTNASYTVRAKNGTVFSSYTNPVRGYTYGSILNINFNQTSAAPFPWNNLNSQPQVGMIWNNFTDDASVKTNIGMENTGVWDGLYGGGLTTGNNSGAVPDAVILESYGLFAGRTSSVKITGLNLAKTYDFTFFASANGVIDATAAYTINGKTSLLNAGSNKTGTMTMYNVVPDENGEVLITVSAYETSQLGLVGSLTIKSYDRNTNAIPAAPAGGAAKGVEELIVSNAVETTPVAAVVEETSVMARTATQEIVIDKVGAGAYPNPFNQNFTLAVAAVKSDKVDVTITDLAGKQIYANRFANINSGVNNLLINPGQNLTSGVYIVTVSFASTGDKKVIKLLKN